jgi:hypothetical protein
LLVLPNLHWNEISCFDLKTSTVSFLLFHVDLLKNIDVFMIYVKNRAK